METTDRNREKIARAVLYVERQLAEPLKASDIARYASLSTYHFQRLFSAYMGEPINQYIISRRLERAAISLIEDPGLNLLRLGLDCGFQTHSAFSRAFKKQFGVTPSEFRKRPFSIREGTDQNRKFLVTAPPGKAIETIGIVDLEPFSFLYRASLGTQDGRFFQENDKDVGQQLAALLCEENAPDLFLMSCFPDSPQSLNDGNVPVWFGGAFSKPTETLWSKEWYQFAGGQWAIFEHRGDFGYLYQTWNRIYRNWLPRSDYVLRDELPFEAYLTYPGKSERSQQLTRIYIPVKRA